MVKKQKKASWLKPLPQKKSHKKRNLGIATFIGGLVATILLTKGKDQPR